MRDKNSSDGFFDSLGYILTLAMGVASICCPALYVYLVLSGRAHSFELNFFGVISFLFPIKFYYDYIRK